MFVWLLTKPLSQTREQSGQKMFSSNGLQIRIATLLFHFNAGDSANAVPLYHKLRTRLTHIWGNRKSQPNRSAMVGPRPGSTAILTTVASVPGKYDFSTKCSDYEQPKKR